MFADLVRFAFFLKERAERRLFTGFLYIIFRAPFFYAFVGLVSPSTVTSSRVTVLWPIRPPLQGCF